MTIEEFDKVEEIKANMLRSFTGHHRGETRLGNWLNRARRMDIVGVYQSSYTWMAMVDHVVGDEIVSEFAAWDPAQGRWRWTCTDCLGFVDDQAWCINPTPLCNKR